MSFLSPAVAIGGREEVLRNRMGIVLSCVTISWLLAVSPGGFPSVHISWHMGGLGGALSLHFAGKAGWADCELGQ